MKKLLSVSNKFLPLLFVLLLLSGCSKSTPSTNSSSFINSELSEASVKSEVSNISSMWTMKPEEIVKVQIIDYGGTEDIKDDKIVFITYQPKSVLNEKDFVRSSANTLVEVSEKLFQNPKVGMVRVWAEGSFTDQYGKQETSPGVKLALSKKTAEKIQWDNFKKLVEVDYNKLLDIADEKTIAPAVSKNL